MVDIKKSLFFQSFKQFSKNQIHSMLFDFLFYFTFILLIIGLYAGAAVLFDMSTTNDFLATLLLILLLLLFYFLSFANIAFFKRIVWNLSIGAKYNFKSFLLLTLAWATPWYLLLFFMRYIAQESRQGLVVLFFAAVFAHFNTVLRNCIQKTIKATVKKTFEIGIYSIYKFILPYLLVLLVFSVVSTLTSFLVKISENVYFVVTMIAFLAVFAWSRLYIHLVIKKIS